MYQPIDPAELSPDQRRLELARILATGVLRLRRIRLLGKIPAAFTQDSVAGGLDVPPETVLSGRNG